MRGYNVRRKRQATMRSSRRNGFSLLDLIMVMSIAVFLFGLLLPTILQNMYVANLVKCKDNLRQIGQAFELYANDNYGKYPRTRYVVNSIEVNSYSNPDAADPFADNGPKVNDVTAAMFLL